MTHEQSMKKQIALVALTHAGLEMALRLQQGLGSSADVYASVRALASMAGAPDARAGAHDVIGFERVGPLLARLWKEYNQLVLFFALGATIRLIAPLIRDKRQDPGVVVMDDAGRFAISVISGHAGGANRLAQHCAELLGAVPVVTTASDVHNTLAVDLLGNAWNWRLEHEANATAVAAAIVNGERVAVLQETGERDWWPIERPWPANLVRVHNLHEVRAAAFAALLLITDRLVEEELPPTIPALIYRPRSLIIGMGCRRGVPYEQLEAFVRATLAVHRLAWSSIATLATADIKANEEGFHLLADRYGWTFEIHPTEALAVVPVPTASEQVQRLAGTPSVSEAAALLSSRGGTLIVPKQRSRDMTIAVARRSYPDLPDGIPNHPGQGRAAGQLGVEREQVQW